MSRAGAVREKRDALSTLVGSLARSVMLSQQPRAVPCISPVKLVIDHAVSPVMEGLGLPSVSHESISVSDIQVTNARLSSAVSRVEALEEQLRDRVSELGQVLTSLTAIQQQSADRLQCLDSVLLKLDHLLVSDRQ